MAFGNVFNGWKIDGISFGLSRVADGSQMIIPWILEPWKSILFFFWNVSKISWLSMEIYESWIHELSKLKNNLAIAHIYF